MSYFKLKKDPMNGKNIWKDNCAQNYNNSNYNST